MHFGVKDSIHYYYICPSCSKTYLAYQKMDEPLEWNSLEKEAWDKRIANVREVRLSVLRKGLDEQKGEVERIHSETVRTLKETTMKKENLIKEIQKKTILIDQLKKDEEELQKKITKENNDLNLINKKIENLNLSQPLA